MHHKLISGDNHIDLTYCPADLWSSQAPAKWKQNAPRVEERNDGRHWFVDDKDRGMWNGVGPGFLPYTKGSLGHVGEMKDAGFVWDSYSGAQPRTTHPAPRTPAPVSPPTCPTPIPRAARPRCRAAPRWARRAAPSPSSE